MHAHSPKAKQGFGFISHAPAFHSISKRPGEPFRVRPALRFFTGIFLQEKVAERRCSNRAARRNMLHIFMRSTCFPVSPARKACGPPGTRQAGIGGSFGEDLGYVPPAQPPLHTQTPCKRTGQRPLQRPVSNAVSTAAAERRVYSYAAITASAFSTSAVS